MKPKPPLFSGLRARRAFPAQGVVDSAAALSYSTPSKNVRTSKSKESQVRLRLCALAATVVSLGTAFLGPPSGGTPQSGPSPTAAYRLIHPPSEKKGKKDVATLEAQLQSAATAGYHVVSTPSGFADELLLVLEKATSQQDRFAYRVLVRNRSEEKKFQQDVEQAATEGYRILPDSWVTYSSGGSEGFGLASGPKISALLLVAEKSPDTPAAKYEYRLLNSHRTSVLENEMNEAAKAEFHPIAMYADVAATLLLERSAQTTPSGMSSTSSYRLIGARKIETLNDELAGAAKEGYRVACVSGAIGSEIKVLLVKGASAPLSEYLVIAPHKPEQLESDIQEASARGFRVVPRTAVLKPYIASGYPTIPVVIMEKSPATPPSEYRTLTGKESEFEALSKRFEEAAQEGFRPAGMVASEAVTIILERPQQHAAGRPRSGANNSL